MRRLISKSRWTARDTRQASAMSKPVLDNSGTAKRAFKANLSKQGRYSLIITGWQAAGESFLSDVTELRLARESSLVSPVPQKKTGPPLRNLV